MKPIWVVEYRDKNYLAWEIDTLCKTRSHARAIRNALTENVKLGFTGYPPTRRYRLTPYVPAVKP